MNWFKMYAWLVIILLIFSCNTADMQSPAGSSDSSSMADHSQNMPDTILPESPQNDTAKMTADTSSVSAPVDSISHITNKSRKAVFGYSFFKTIQQHETRNVNAYVSVLNSISKVIDTLKQINTSEIPERKSDTAVIFTKNMFVFKALTVHLLNAGDSDFIIKPFAEARQNIDSLDGNSWTWAVTPLTNKKNSRLIMNVVVEKADGSREPFSIINIPIDINLDTHIERTIWQWMMDNPKETVTIILIPFIIFFWKQITGFFKKKDGKKNEP